MSAVALPDLNALPADALRALILAQHEQLISREREIEHLRLLLAKLQRMQFGRKSEKLERQIEQLEAILGGLDGQLSLKSATLTIDQATRGNLELVRTLAGERRERLRPRPRRRPGRRRWPPRWRTLRCWCHAM